MEEKQLYKRTWVYCQNPKDYQMSCDKCGGTNIEWSEFEGHIFCYDCKIDTPGNKGIFDGPIPIHAAKILGMSFDRIDLQTHKLLKFNFETNSYE